MARPKKKQEDSCIEFGAPQVDDILVTDTSILSADDCAPDTKNEVPLEAPEVFLDGITTVAVEVKDRSFDNVNETIRNDVANVTTNKSLSDIELLRMTAAKLRAKKAGKRSPMRRGHVNAKFSIH